MANPRRTATEKLILFVAQGFGAGLFPIGPGTIGTIIGFVWIYLLLVPGNLLIYFGGLILGFFAAVWLGARGEEILGRKDPGSIVIDEITALPLAFAGALLPHGLVTPHFAYYLEGKRWMVLVLTFTGFRIFDIAKPWMIEHCQSLPGGWGLVIDDFAAALHVLPFTWICAVLME